MSQEQGRPAAKTAAAAGKRACVGIRMHNFGEAEAQLHEALSRHFDPRDIYFVIDETRGPVEVPAGYNRIGFDRAALDALGLFADHPAIGWLCGDYFLYFLRQARDADFYWLVETDVRFTHVDIGNFFRRYDGLATDFLAPRFGPRGADWGWYKTAAPFAEKVYGCAFPVTRASRRALDLLLSARQDLGRQQRQSPWPNDESFVATTLMKAGLACAPMESAAPNAFTHFDVFHPYCWDHARGHIPPGKVVHPAMPASQYWNSFPRKMRDVLLQSDLGRLVDHGLVGADSAHLERMRAEFLAVAGQWFDARAGSPPDDAVRAGPGPAERGVATPSRESPTSGVFR